MQFQSIPRGSIAALLTATDLVSRSESTRNQSRELRHAVAIVSRYLMDTNYWPDVSEVDRSLELIDALYGLSNGTPAR
jgi:hypothetical protein